MLFYLQDAIFKGFFTIFAEETIIDMAFRVKDICKAQGITMKELASKLSITETGLRKILAGNPTIGTLEKIAKALGVELTDLFEPKSVQKIVCPHCGKILFIELKKEQ